MLFTCLSKLIFFLGVKHLKFFLKLLQYVFSQDVPLQSICSPSPQTNDLKRTAGMSLWQIPIINCDIIMGKDETPPSLHINSSERQERTVHGPEWALTGLSEGNDCEDASSLQNNSSRSKALSPGLVCAPSAETVATNSIRWNRNLPSFTLWVLVSTCSVSWRSPARWEDRPSQRTVLLAVQGSTKKEGLSLPGVMEESRTGVSRRCLN